MNWTKVNMAAKKSINQKTQLARQLKAVLELDLEYSRQMLCVLNAQTEALLANDARSVSLIDRHAKSVIRKQQSNDTERTAAVTALARELGVQVDDDMPVPTLSDLALNLPLSEARGVLGLRMSILENHAKIKETNERNRLLAENALAWVRASLDAIRECAFKPARYGTNPNTITPAVLYINQTA
jgi:hypothetical protein